MYNESNQGQHSIPFFFLQKCWQVQDGPLEVVSGPPMDCHLLPTPDFEYTTSNEIFIGQKQIQFPMMSLMGKLICLVLYPPDLTFILSFWPFLRRLLYTCEDEEKVKRKDGILWADEGRGLSDFSIQVVTWILHDRRIGHSFKQQGKENVMLGKIGSSCLSKMSWKKGLGQVYL